MNTINRVKVITNALKNHKQVHGIRDLDVHCLCGWSAPRHTGGHLDHQARHIENDLTMADLAVGSVENDEGGTQVEDRPALVYAECPICQAQPGEPCIKMSGMRSISKKSPHEGRLKVTPN